MDEDFKSVPALIDGAFDAIQRDEACTLHHAQLSDQSLSREISEDGMPRSFSTPKPIGEISLLVPSMDAMLPSRTRARRAGTSISRRI
jgi:hypothetical protein